MDETLYRNWFLWAQEHLGPDTEAADRAACAAVEVMTAGLGYAAAERAARDAASRKHQASEDDSAYAERLGRMHKTLAPVYVLDQDAAQLNHVGRLHAPTQRGMVVRRLTLMWAACLALVIVGISIIFDAGSNPGGTLLGTCLLLLAVLPAYLSRAHIADLNERAVDSVSGSLRKEIAQGADDRSYYLTVMRRRFQVSPRCSSRSLIANRSPFAPAVTVALS